LHIEDDLSGYIGRTISAGSAGFVAGTLTGAGRLQGRCMSGSLGPVAGQWSAASSLVLRAQTVIWSFGRPYCADGPGASLCSSLSDGVRCLAVELSSITVIPAILPLVSDIISDLILQRLEV